MMTFLLATEVICGYHTGWTKRKNSFSTISLRSRKMHSAREICFLVIFGHISFFTSAKISHQQTSRLERFYSLNCSCTVRSESLNAPKGWRPDRESYLPVSYRFFIDREPLQSGVELKANF